MFDYIAVSVWLHEEQWLQIRSALTGLHQIAGIMRPLSTLTGRVPPEKWKQCEHRKIKTNSSIWELIAGNGQIFEKRRFYKKSPDRINHWGMLFSCPAMQLFFGHLKYSSPDLSHGAFQIIWIKISYSMPASQISAIGDVRDNHCDNDEARMLNMWYEPLHLRYYWESIIVS